MTAEQLCEKSKKARQNLIETPQVQQAKVIMAFMSLPHEVDTAGFILYGWQNCKTIAVPKVSWQQRHMIPVQINSLETGISIEAGGLKNPVTGTPVLIEDIDLVVTPGLAFDKKGNRLGRGGSYYDRFFRNDKLRAIKCGLCFAEQVVDSVPTHGHDESIDMLVTDEEVIYFKTQE